MLCKLLDFCSRCEVAVQANPDAVFNNDSKQNENVPDSSGVDRAKRASKKNL